MLDYDLFYAIYIRNLKFELSIEDDSLKGKILIIIKYIKKIHALREIFSKR